MALLLECLGGGAGDAGCEASAAVARTIRPGLDYNFLHAAAIRHGVQPLVFRRLNRLPSTDVPPAVLRSMARECVLNSVRSEHYARTLVDLLVRLADDGVTAVPYKGPALSTRVHGDPSMRWIGGDLDILVRRCDARRSIMVLESAGYRPADWLQWRRRDVLHSYHVEMTAPDRPMVEVHWRLVDDIDFPACMDDWWGRLIKINLTGKSVPVLPPAETLVALSLHGGKDAWNRLMLVSDVAALLRTHPLDWTQVTDLTTTRDSRRAVLLALLLARDLLGADIPQDASDQLEDDGELHRLAGRIARRLVDGTRVRVRMAERLRLAMNLRHRAHERAQYLADYLRVLMTPDKEDIDWVPLPPALRGGYYITRQIRRLSGYLREARLG